MMTLSGNDINELMWYSRGDINYLRIWQDKRFFKLAMLEQRKLTWQEKFQVF